MSADKLHQQYADAENARYEASQKLNKAALELADIAVVYQEAKKRCAELRERLREKLQKVDR